MLNSDFHEGHRRPLSHRQSVFGLMRLRSVQSYRDAISLRTRIQQCLPYFLLVVTRTDLWWDANPLCRVADISGVRRYAPPIPLQEESYAQCEKGKALLFM